MTEKLKHYFRNCSNHKASEYPNATSNKCLRILDYWTFRAATRGLQKPQRIHRFLPQMLFSSAVVFSVSQVQKKSGAPTQKVISNNHQVLRYARLSLITSYKCVMIKSLSFSNTQKCNVNIKQTEVHPIQQGIVEKTIIL